MPIRYKNEYAFGRLAKGAIPSAINIFSLKDMNIERKAFLSYISTLFDDLPWDEYDIPLTVERYMYDKHKHIHTDNLALWASKWEKEDTDISFWLDFLSEEEQVLLKSLKPFRKRGAKKMELIYNDNSEWVISELPMTRFVQDVNDIRARPRKFTDFHTTLEQFDFLCRVLTFFGSIILSRNYQFEKIKCTVHLMKTFCWGNKFYSPAPEGIHQDGANYILSALVTERENVTGGVSQVYSSDKKQLIFQKQLEVGEGLFQEDTQGGYWHNITSIKPINTSEEGFRSILGIDFVLE